MTGPWLSLVVSVAQPVDSAGRFANLDYEEVEVDSVEVAKLDAEAFEVDLQVDEVPGTKGVETVEVGDFADLLHSADAEEGGLSEPGMLTEVGLLMSGVVMPMSAVERRPH